MKIALVHDHLVSDGGGERVLKAFTELWPEAPIYTLIHRPDKAPKFTRGKEIHTSFLQKLPLGTTKYQWYLPLRAIATERMDFADYDVVLSNSSAHAKGVKVPAGALHINYCHTPTRYLWIDTQRLDPLERIWPISFLSDLYKKRLRKWDLMAAQRVPAFIVNSRNVQERLSRIYDRPAEIIYPPVATQRFSSHPLQGGDKGGVGLDKNPPRSPLAKGGGDYFLTGGRLVAYKRFDIVVEAFTRLNMPLWVFGVGPDLARLKSMAGENVKFLRRVSDDQLPQLYSEALAFINPQEEDFGITAVEAQASGRPVIAYQAGGALEIVKSGATGEFFEDQDWEALASKVIKFKPKNYEPELIMQHADKFSEANFKSQIKDFVESKYDQYLRA